MKKLWKKYLFPVLAGFAVLTAASLGMAQEGDTITGTAVKIPWLPGLSM